MVEASGTKLDVVAFVRASVYRASVLLSLLDWPKTTSQVALACGLNTAHASRAIHELTSRGLVECATPDIRGRGKLYSLTLSGQEIADAFDWDSSQLKTPLVRGTHPRAWYLALASRFGTNRAMECIRLLNLGAVVESPSGRWIPLRLQMRLLGEIEERFGDGSNQLIRNLAREAVRYYPSVRHYLLRALPWRVVLDLCGMAYLREFNHGRVEVETVGRRALVKHFDWLSSPARCAAWFGSWEGILEMRDLPGEVEKRDCILDGSDYCSYTLEWEQWAADGRKRNGPERMRLSMSGRANDPSTH